MASLASIIDKRTFVRGMVLGFRTANAIFDAIVDHIPGVIRAKHNDDGSFNCREACRITGNYKWNGATKYTLQKQASSNPYLPTEITPSSAGVVPIVFTTSLPEALYDLEITPGLDLSNDVGRYGIDFDAAEKTIAKCRFKFKNAADADAYPSGFTVVIKWGS